MPTVNARRERPRRWFRHIPRGHAGSSPGIRGSYRHPRTPGRRNRSRAARRRRRRRDRPRPPIPEVPPEEEGDEAEEEDDADRQVDAPEHRLAVLPEEVPDPEADRDGEEGREPVPEEEPPGPHPGPARREERRGADPREEAGDEDRVGTVPVEELPDPAHALGPQEAAEGPEEPDAPPVAAPQPEEGRVPGEDAGEADEDGRRPAAARVHPLVPDLGVDDESPRQDRDLLRPGKADPAGEEVGEDPEVIPAEAARETVHTLRRSPPRPRSARRGADPPARPVRGAPKRGLRVSPRSRRSRRCRGASPPRRPSGRCRGGARGAARGADPRSGAARRRAAPRSARGARDR